LKLTRQHCWDSSDKKMWLLELILKVSFVFW